MEGLLNGETGNPAGGQGNAGGRLGELSQCCRKWEWAWGATTRARRRGTKDGIIANEMMKRCKITACLTSQL